MTAIIRVTGAAFAATLPVAKVVLATDGFSRAAGAALGSTEVGALPWIAAHSTDAPTLTGTALRVKAVEGGKSAAIVEGPTAAVEVGASWVANATTVTTGIAGVLARANLTGTSGYFFGPAYLGAGSIRWLLGRLDNNVLTWLQTGPASGSANRPVQGDAFSVRCVGSTIEGRVNGAVLLTATDAAYSTAKHCGIIAIGSAGGGTQSDFDSFKVLPA
ncbi:hypothetical protein [Paenarthrobacter ilicis]|uniref:hypothetical protein n=1 Tax=Paenarthrobacter ilicis TaxID=43665 RepID=UPI003865E41C